MHIVGSFYTRITVRQQFSLVSMCISLPKFGQFQGDGRRVPKTSRAAFTGHPSVVVLRVIAVCMYGHRSHNSLVDSLAMQHPMNHLSLVFPGGVIGDHVQRQG